MLNRIDRYVLRQIMGPLLITLGIAALLLILERMLKLFDFVVNQGGPVEVVFQMLANQIPHYLGLALPVGLLLGTLLAFRKISLSSEYDAIVSSGIGLPRLMRPVLMLSLLMMLINTVLVGWIQPYGRYAYRNLVFDLRSGALGASVRVGEFVDLGDNITLMIEESRQQGAELVGIFLERRDEKNTISVTAERGGFFATEDDQTILLRLYNGVLVDLNEGQNKPRVLSFDQQDLTVKLPAKETFRDRGGEELELTLPELNRERYNPALTEKEANAMNANFHWRIMHSVTFLVLPFLAIPMGLTNKRTARGTGIVIGLSLLILYNEFMEATETAVTNGASPYATTWLLFSMFTVLSLFFFHIAAYRVGGEPLAWIDRSWAVVSGPMKRLSKRLMGVSD